jgi:hypothetical protein
MIQAILWWVVWASIPVLLSVAKDDIQVILESVKTAETLKHDDGGLYTSAEKRNYVLGKALIILERSLTELPLRMINAMIELAVVYVKGKT